MTGLLAPEGLAVEPSERQAGLQLTDRRRRVLGLLAALAVLLLGCTLSLVLGSQMLPLDETLTALVRDNGMAHTIVVEQRIPRTVLAVLVGIALAVAGALMQGLTRNPLADPGLLGVSAGASFAMLVAVMLDPGAGRLTLVGASFVGAVVTTVVVYMIGAAGRRGSSPVTLVLAGVAIGAVLSGITATLELLSARLLLSGRTFAAGSLENRGWETVLMVAPCLVVGLLLAALAARGLNAFALGEDLAAALGANQWVTRTAVVVAVTVLCGSATAAIGLVWFVGLMVPHVARWLTGPDQRWVLAYSCVLGPALMVAADVVGRVVVIPDEIPAGLVTAFVGAPVLVWMVRRHGASAL